jgi:hypothetical protein
MVRPDRFEQPTELASSCAAIPRWLVSRETGINSRRSGELGG